MRQPLVTPPPHKGPAIPYEVQLDNARSSLPGDLPVDARKVLVALDIDGTLLTAHGATPRVSRVVHEAIDAGMNVVIATGRGIPATRPVFEELRLPTGYSVSANGAQTIRWTRTQDGRHVYEKLSETYFDPREPAEAILRAVPGAILATDDGQEGMRVSRLFPVGELGEGQRKHELQEMLDLPTVRMVARAPWLEREDFAHALSSARLPGVECAVGWTSWADITAASTTKAHALARLAEDLGVAPTGTVAVGDGSNDITMLRWAHHGVAMGGAAPEVVAAAKATTGAVDHDGAAAVLQALLERF